MKFGILVEFCSKNFPRLKNLPNIICNHNIQKNLMIFKVLSKNKIFLKSLQNTKIDKNTKFNEMVYKDFVIATEFYQLNVYMNYIGKTK